MKRAQEAEKTYGRSHKWTVKDLREANRHRKITYMHIMAIRYFGSSWNM